MSTVKNLQSFDANSYAEGSSILTYQQYLAYPIARIRPNSKDILVYNGRKVEDNFFDENLIDINVGGAITNAPNSYLEVRTLGNNNSGEPGFTDMTDFQPVAYLNDEGTVMYPSTMNAGGFSDPINSSGIIGMFESRLEITGINNTPSYAKKGLKVSPSFSAESIDKKFYPIYQKIARTQDSKTYKASKYFEIGSDDLSQIIEDTTYPDQQSPSSFAFVDSSDSNISGDISDSQIASILASGNAGSLYVERDWLSSTAGWTMINKSNGTDSIVYSDRM